MNREIKNIMKADIIIIVYKIAKNMLVWLRKKNETTPGDLRNNRRGTDRKQARGKAKEQMGRPSKRESGGYGIETIIGANTGQIKMEKSDKVKLIINCRG